MKVKQPVKDKRLLLSLREEKHQESTSNELAHCTDLINKYLDNPNKTFSSPNEE